MRSLSVKKKIAKQHNLTRISRYESFVKAYAHSVFYKSFTNARSRRRRGLKSRLLRLFKSTDKAIQKRNSSVSRRMHTVKEVLNFHQNLYLGTTYVKKKSKIVWERIY